MNTPVHVLSERSALQRRNVFIWCSFCHNLSMGWRIDDDSPTTVSTAYRWITTAVRTRYPNYEPDPFALFPVEIQPAGVLTYSIQRNGSALSQQPYESIRPGDYGIYTEDGSKPRMNYRFTPLPSFSETEMAFKDYSVALATKASLTSSIAQQALDRDRQCCFSEFMPRSESDVLVSTWIFPPFLGYTLSDDSWLENKYHNDPGACDLSEFTVVTNVISGRKDIVTLFWENKLGVDVDDAYRIVIFEGSECLNSGVPLKNHLALVDKPCRPDDRFLRLHFQQCLAVSAFGGDATEDYGEQEIELFMEELGVYDAEMDTTDPRWASPLGIEVYAYLIRKKLAAHAADEEIVL